MTEHFNPASQPTDKLPVDHQSEDKTNREMGSKENTRDVVCRGGRSAVHVCKGAWGTSKRGGRTAHPARYAGWLAARPEATVSNSARNKVLVTRYSRKETARWHAR